jgi:hypothetical protein
VRSQHVLRRYAFQVSVAALLEQPALVQLPLFKNIETCLFISTIIMQSRYRRVYGPKAPLTNFTPLLKTPQLSFPKNLLVGQIVGGRVFSARRIIIAN